MCFVRADLKRLCANANRPLIVLGKGGVRRCASYEPESGGSVQMRPPPHARGQREGDRVRTDPSEFGSYKHIDVRCHFLRELVSKKMYLSIEHVHSAEQHVDVLAKALAFDPFTSLRRMFDESVTCHGIDATSVGRGRYFEVLAHVRSPPGGILLGFG